MSASAGRVLIIPRGEYDGTVTYNMLDLVTYQNGSYLAKQTTTGNLPTDTTYWQEMITTPDMTGASAGAAGVHGLVPAPSAGDQAKYLRGDATWAAVDLSSKADQSIIGGSYNASTAYEPGDRFSYNGVRYKVIIESGTVSGQTPPNANYYEVCSVDDDISQLNNSLTWNLIETVTATDSDYSAGGTYNNVTRYSATKSLTTTVSALKQYKELLLQLKFYSASQGTDNGYMECGNTIVDTSNLLTNASQYICVSAPTWWGITYFCQVSCASNVINAYFASPYTSALPDKMKLRLKIFGR